MAVVAARRRAGPVLTARVRHFRHVRLQRPGVGIVVVHARVALPQSGLGPPLTRSADPALCARCVADCGSSARRPRGRSRTRASVPLSRSPARRNPPGCAACSCARCGSCSSSSTPDAYVIVEFMSIELFPWLLPPPHKSVAYGASAQTWQMLHRSCSPPRPGSDPAPRAVPSQSYSCSTDPSAAACAPPERPVRRHEPAVAVRALRPSLFAALVAPQPRPAPAVAAVGRRPVATPHRPRTSASPRPCSPPCPPA